VAKYIDTFKGWTDTFREDVSALKSLLESKDADLEARKLAAAALGYLVTRMDLVPDFNEGIGAFDDVMVLRVTAQLTAGHKLGTLSSESDMALGRLQNEADHIAHFLGKELYDKLRAYTARLADTTVRGRTTLQIVDDDAARAALYAEVEDEIKKSAPVVITDADDAELRFKAYLSHKLL
jgi:uncharacterized membrane protein YkvA (DUF1232 family)